jgi:hypothetical protein
VSPHLCLFALQSWQAEDLINIVSLVCLSGRYWDGSRVKEVKNVRQQVSTKLIAKCLCIYRDAQGLMIFIAIHMSTLVSAVHGEVYVTPG